MTPLSTASYIVPTTTQGPPMVEGVPQCERPMCYSLHRHHTLLTYLDVLILGDLPMDPLNVLKVDGLTKSFGRRTVVNDVSFHVRRGEMFGFLGPNGSGKTTTIRMGLGIIRPNHGSVEILGSLPERRVLKNVGYLPEERGLTKKVKVVEILRYLGRLKGMPAAEALRAVRCTGRGERVRGDGRQPSSRLGGVGLLDVVCHFADGSGHDRRRNDHSKRFGGERDSHGGDADHVRIPDVDS